MNTVGVIDFDTAARVSSFGSGASFTLIEHSPITRFNEEEQYVILLQKTK